MMQQEKNKELELAWEYVNHTSMNLFLTGKAGTGKTTFLKKVVEECPKRKIVLAPTGVAAINAGGVTLHSFFQLPFGLFLPDYVHVQAHDKQGRYRFHKKKLQLIQSVELMIIDEVSMLRADIVDELDALLRKLRRVPKPFGGVQVLMIGDVQQLSPVVKPEEWEMMKQYYPSPYFFDARVLKEHPCRMVELHQIYRQKDDDFIEILSAVRNNRLTAPLLEKLNSRYLPDYEAPEGCITLCTHNYTANAINQERLDAIHSRTYTYQARITGNFPESMYPQEVELLLKKGAQVMFTKNDPNPEKMYVNGTLGTVLSLDKEHITVGLQQGGEVEVEPLAWENLKYSIHEETKEIVSDIDGLFTQYPLKLAWAITIHKSQGLTFDHAVIDASHSFSHGQVYVALSRCRTLEGMVLRNRLSISSIVNDRRVENFADFVTDSLPSPDKLAEDKRNYCLEVLQDLFDFQEQARYYGLYLKFARASFPGVYPKALEDWEQTEAAFQAELSEVGKRFGHSLERLVGADWQTSDYLQERVCKACAYFRRKTIDLLFPLVKVSYAIDFDDQDKKKLNHQYFSRFLELMFTRLFLWNYSLEGFNLDDFVQEKSMVFSEIQDMAVSRLLAMLGQAMEHPHMGFLELEKWAQSQKKEKRRPAAAAEDLLHPGLYRQLKSWRDGQAASQSLPAYRILQQKALVAIANDLPLTAEELKSIKGIGKVFMQKYGSDVLELVRQFAQGTSLLPND